MEFDKSIMVPIPKDTSEFTSPVNAGLENGKKNSGNKSEVPGNKWTQREPSNLIDIQTRKYQSRAALQIVITSAANATTAKHRPATEAPKKPYNETSRQI